ncbi:unnamed protein product [Closterium sp. NIES-65]|nr:unnamed protein product [Closterium sp. NIES-65]
MFTDWMTVLAMCTAISMSAPPFMNRGPASAEEEKGGVSGAGKEAEKARVVAEGAGEAGGEGEMAVEAVVWAEGWGEVWEGETAGEDSGAEKEAEKAEGVGEDWEGEGAGEEEKGDEGEAKRGAGRGRVGERNQ